MSNGTARQPRWDKYEAAILLDGYLETIRANTPKHRIVKRVSKELRQMAQNRGIVIDEVYRNENGISYQIQSMESAYHSFVMEEITHFQGLLACHFRIKMAKQFFIEWT